MEAAFFDLDKTVIAKATLVAYSQPLRQEGYISHWLMARALWAHLVFNRIGASEERLRRYREQALRIAKGWDQVRLSELVRETIADIIDPLVYDEALELIDSHRDAGRRVYLVSASPLEIVAPLGAYLGVDDVIATRAQIDEHLRYTGEVEFYAYGANKVVAIEAEVAQHGIDMERSYAYSDSHTDVPLLAAVGHPVAVNPDRELLRIATARGWEIRRFERPVAMRSRLALPSRRTAVISGGTAAAMAALAGAGWAWARNR
ncbi:MAG: HAD-IB family hydrolase [Acidimicrobiia bacterium]|nr:HAD-IB family hydrolase [Acidimicrobiia bacterium]